MKKIFSVMMLLATCVFGVAAQTLNADAYGVDMIMPDGVTATIAFYKKWGPANEAIKAVQPKDKKPMIGTTMTKAKTESDIGYFRKTYKADESKDIADICEAMKSCGAKYGVAWVDYGNRVTRCVFTYKGEKLTYDRMDFFDETNEAYADFVAKENERREKMNAAIKSIVSKLFGAKEPLSPKEFKQELYRARHAPRELMDAWGNIIICYLIFSDEGYCYSTNNPHLVVDQNGRFRVYNFNNCMIIPSSEVSQEVKEAAQKSLY